MAHFFCALATVLLVGCDNPCPTGTEPHESEVTDGNETACVDEQGRKQGPWTRTYYGGQPLARGQSVDGVDDGLIVTWWPDGKTRSEATWRDGARNGRERTWNAAGHLILDGVRKNGRWEGEVRFFDANGKPKHSATWRDGKRHGVSRTWHPNGTVLALETYENAVRHGLHEKRSEDGKLVEQGQYRTGKIDGTWIRVRPDGTRTTRKYQGDYPAQAPPPRRVGTDDQPLLAPADSGPARWQRKKAARATVVLDRPTVPNLTLRLFSWPGLQPLGATRLPLDTGTGLFPRPGCPTVLRSWTIDPDGARHFVLRTRPLKLTPATKAQLRSCDGGELHHVPGGDRTTLTLGRDNQTVTLPLPAGARGLGAVHPWPDGDAALLQFSDGSVALIEDMKAPQLRPIPTLRANINSVVALGPNRTAWVAIWHANEGKYPYVSTLARLDFGAGTGTLHLTDLGPYAPHRLLFVPELGVLLYHNAHGDPLLVIDAATGEVRHRIDVGNEAAVISTLPRPQGPLILWGNRRVNVVTGKLEAATPGLYPISARVLSPDGRHLIYATRDPKADGNPLDFGLVVAREIDTGHELGRVAAPAMEGDGGPIMPQVRALFFTPDGNLAVTTGDAVVYANHGPGER